MNKASDRSTAWCALMLAAAWLLSSGCTTPSSPSTAAPSATAGTGAMKYTHDQVRKMAILVQPVRNQTGDLAGIISGEFLTAFIAKGYDVVTAESIHTAVGELRKRADEAYDVSAAAEVGKLVQASHVLLVKVPVLTWNQVGHNAYPHFTMVAQMVEVETGLIRGVAQDAKRGSDAAWGHSRDLPHQVQRVAQRIAGQFP